MFHVRMPNNVMRCNAVLYHVLAWHATLRYASYHIIPRRITLHAHSVVSCRVV